MNSKIKIRPWWKYPASQPRKSTIQFLRKPILKTSVNKNRYWTILLLASVLFLRVAWAQDIDENELFSNDSSLIESNEHLEQDVGKSFDKESVAFSGRLMTRGVYYMSRSWLYEKGSSDTNQLSNTSEGDFFIDARLKNGVKGFVNISIETIGHEFDPLKAMGEETSDTEDPESDMKETAKEFFIDANIERKAYFRIGKQVLKWGRTYFWNATDFINIEKRDFLDMNRYREGVYGTRVHLPFGSQKNIYLFMNFSSAEDTDDVALAAKYEFLIKNSEFSLSAWNKRGTGNAVGFDFSTNLFGMYVNSEACLYHQDTYFRIVGKGDALALKEEKNKESVRLSFGFTKMFDYELSDRISLTYEFFYNGTGYEENVFDDVASAYEKYVSDDVSDAELSLFNELYNELYEPNYHGKYYSAFFGSINKYPIPDMTVNLNILSNMSDGSFVIVPGFSYEPVDHFTVSFNLDFFGGPENTEYTFMNSGIACDLLIELQF